MKKIIIDCDSGIDDALALMLALNCKDYDILGITSVNGNVSAEQSYINILRILNFEKKFFPIYMEKNKNEKFLLDAKNVHGDDGLGNSYLPYEYENPSGNSISFILDTLRKSNEEITILALGPLTNIAKALMIDKSAFKNCNIISMGGAFRVKGNVSPLSEFNYWFDANSVDYILKNYPNKLNIVPLDITQKFILTPNILYFLKHLDKEKATFIENITEFYMDFYFKEMGIIGAIINDPLTILVDLFPNLFRFEEHFCEVCLEGLNKGALIIDEKSNKKSNIKIYTYINEEKVMKEFILILFPNNEDLINKTNFK